MSAAPMWTPVENRVTGDRMLVLRRGREAGGETLEVQFDLPPHAAGSPMHRHRVVEERFEVLDGALRMCVDGVWQTLRSGESLVVRAGQSHCFRNDSGAWVTFVTDVRPAANFERFLRTWYGLANTGRTSADGVPRNPLHLARCLQDADFTFSGAPAPLQRLLFATLVLIGSKLGVYASLAEIEAAPLGWSAQAVLR
jgi:quercetin dioxygenase-like cupin family protein